MIEDILAQYGHAKDEYTITSIGSGLINDTWKVQQKDTSYLLQKINTTVFKNPEAIAENTHELAVYFAQNHPGYLFPTPIYAPDQRKVVKAADGSYYRLARFICGSITTAVVQSPSQAYEAAKKFGQFTHLLQDFPLEKLNITIPDFHNLALRYKQFEACLATGNKERIDKSEALINYVFSQQALVSIYQTIVSSPHFQKRVTHHDTKISNVLFDIHHHALCVIDLDTVMPGFFISDVGDMTRTYVCPVSEEEADFSRITVRPDYYKAIYDGYMYDMGNHLSDVEKNHFLYAGKFMIYMQLIRFLTDYINDDIYYGSSYPGQNLVRAGNQATLLQKLTEAEDTLI